MNDETPMTCPNCTSEMEPGVVLGRAPGVKFKNRRSTAGDLGGIRLTKGFFNHSVEAWHCPSCATVVIPG